ncbi:MAG: hypothetical protein ICV83_23270 [Cytophagales bacterium]|nr:hypothetical protein [Cytophagales bacterium]
MTTSTLSARNGNRFENGKELERVTPVSPASEKVQQWFNAQTLPGLPLHLELLLMGVWEVEG